MVARRLSGNGVVNNVNRCPNTRASSSVGLKWFFNYVLMFFYLAIKTNLFPKKYCCVSNLSDKALQQFSTSLYTYKEIG